MLVASDFSDDITTIGGTMTQYCQSPDDPAYIAAPDNSQQVHGVKPLDRLPAQWWNWFLNQATRRFGEYEKYVQNALSELNNILSITGETPSSSTAVTDQLQTLFQNAYLQSFLPEVIDGADDFAVDTTHAAKILVSDDDGNGAHSVTTIPYAPRFIMNTQISTASKNINLPSNSPYEGQTIKVLFSNGHTASSSSDYMTLDVNSSGTPATVAVNQNGTLINLPIHEITAGTYSVLQDNTCLDMYYTNSGLSNNPSWVIIGNPVVLSSSTYSIYADGSKIEQPVDSVTDGDMRPVTANAVYDALSGTSVTEQYIRDQNILYIWELLGTGTNLSGWTSSWDGYIQIWRDSGSGWTGSLHRGGGNIDLSQHINNGGTNVAYIPVCKGDYITIQGSSSDGYIKGSFYKSRDYTGR